MTNALDDLIASADDVQFPGGLIASADQLTATVIDAFRHIGLDTDNVDQVRGAVAGVLVAEALGPTFGPATVAWTMSQHANHLQEGLTS